MPSNTKKLPIISLVDLKRTNAEIGDKFKIVIRYFFEDVEDYIKNINLALTNNSMDQVFHSAHTIKSSSKIIAALRISELATQLEYFAQSPKPNLKKIQSHFDQLKITVQKTKQKFINLGFL
jgi:HPt (histidine-containing phosphotransfer) domain-containing protein